MFLPAFLVCCTIGLQQGTKNLYLVLKYDPQEAVFYKDRRGLDLSSAVGSRKGSWSREWRPELDRKKLQRTMRVVTSEMEAPIYLLDSF